MTVLTAEMLTETHPVLPYGWRKDMHTIKKQGGPWKCPSCNGPSYLVYRCSSSGRDLCDEGNREVALGV